MKPEACRTRSPRLVALLCLALSAVACGEQEGAEYACPECDVVVEHQLDLLNAPPAAEPDVGSSVVQLASGSYVTGTTDPDRLAIFAADGRFVSLLGQAGDGPGEFREVTDVAMAGDTLYVLSADRVTVFSPELQTLRTITPQSPGRPRLMALTRTGDLMLVNNGLWQTEDDRLWRSSADGEEQRRSGMPGAGSAADIVSDITIHRDTLWAVTHEHEILAADGTGATAQAAMMLPRWYVAGVADAAEEEDLLPPSARDIHVTDSLVWIIYSQPKKRERPSTVASGPVAPARMSPDEWAERSPSIIVAFDRTTGLPLAELRPAFAIGGFMADGRLYGLAENAAGDVRMPIYRLRLARAQ